MDRIIQILDPRPPAGTNAADESLESSHTLFDLNATVPVSLNDTGAGTSQIDLGPNDIQDIATSTLDNEINRVFSPVLPAGPTQANIDLETNSEGIKVSHSGDPLGIGSEYLKGILGNITKTLTAHINDQFQALQERFVNFTQLNTHNELYHKTINPATPADADQQSQTFQLKPSNATRDQKSIHVKLEKLNNSNSEEEEEQRTRSERRNHSTSHNEVSRILSQNQSTEQTLPKQDVDSASRSRSNIQAYNREQNHLANSQCYESHAVPLINPPSHQISPHPYTLDGVNISGHRPPVMTTPNPHVHDISPSTVRPHVKPETRNTFCACDHLCSDRSRNVVNDKCVTHDSQNFSPSVPLISDSSHNHYKDAQRVISSVHKTINSWQFEKALTHFESFLRVHRVTNSHHKLRLAEQAFNNNIVNKFYASSKELSYESFLDFARANEFSRADCYKSVKIKLHDPKSTQQALDFIESQVRDPQNEREKAAILRAAPAELQEILKGHLSLPLDSFKKVLNDINTPSSTNTTQQNKKTSPFFQQRKQIPQDLPTNPQNRPFRQHNGVSEDFRHPRNQYPHNSQPHTLNGSSYCFYHSRFGPKAFRCAGPWCPAWQDQRGNFRQPNTPLQHPNNTNPPQKNEQ